MNGSSITKTPARLHRAKTRKARRVRVGLFLIISILFIFYYHFLHPPYPPAASAKPTAPCHSDHGVSVKEWCRKARAAEESLFGQVHCGSPAPASPRRSPETRSPPRCRSPGHGGHRHPIAIWTGTLWARAGSESWRERRRFALAGGRPRDAAPASAGGGASDRR